MDTELKQVPIDEQYYLVKCEVTDQQDESVPVDNELVFQHFFCQTCPDYCCKRTWKKKR